MKSVSIPRKRNSSVELLRIIAMSMVLLTHYNWSMLGANVEKVAFEGSGVFRIIFESCIVICVNLFLLISGFYSIKFKLRSVFNIGILVASVLLIQFLWTYFVGPHIGHEAPGKITPGAFVGIFLFISSSDYFVVDYLFLMFLSPILNSFIDKYDEKVIPYVIALFCIETWFECVLPNKWFGFNEGYSIVHFVLMYLLARCLYLKRDCLSKFRPERWLFVYFLCVIINSVLYTNGVHFSFYYSNPFVVIEAISFFMLFANREFYNKIINWIASGTFAVYILHRYNPIHDWLKYLDNMLYSTDIYIVYIMKSLPVLIILFFSSILYDKVLDLVRKPILSFCDYIETKYLSFVKQVQ